MILQYLVDFYVFHILMDIIINPLAYTYIIKILASHIT